MSDPFEDAHSLREYAVAWATRARKLETQRNDLLAALQEIEKGEGRFDLDHKQHAINTIENMKAIARIAIAKATE